MWQALCGSAHHQFVTPKQKGLLGRRRATHPRIETSVCIQKNMSYAELWVLGEKSVYGTLVWARSTVAGPFLACEHSGGHLVTVGEEDRQVLSSSGVHGVFDPTCSIRVPELQQPL